MGIDGGAGIGAGGTTVWATGIASLTVGGASGGTTTSVRLLGSRGGGAEALLDDRIRIRLAKQREHLPPAFDARTVSDGSRSARSSAMNRASAAEPPAM